MSVSDDTEARKLQRELLKLNEKLKTLGVFCGIPVIQPGDHFVLPEGNTQILRLLRRYVSFVHAIEEIEKLPGDDSSKLESLPKVSEVQEPVVRNSWRITYGRGRTERQFVVRIVEVNPEAPESERRVRLEKMQLMTNRDYRYKHAVATHYFGRRALLGAERKAHKKLEELLSPEDFEHYVLTGGILVKGKSGVSYFIRKHRPTIAFRKTEKGGHKLLCALCLHPLGYFEDSWAGALPPTDELIAHLLYIRGDEHFFWKKANHIPIDEPNSGI